MANLKYRFYLEHGSGRVEEMFVIAKSGHYTEIAAIHACVLSPDFKEINLHQTFNKGIIIYSHIKENLWQQ